MNKISNEENILNLRKRERIRVVMIILCIVIIGLAFASLIFDNFIHFEWLSFKILHTLFLRINMNYYSFYALINFLVLRKKI